MAPVNTGISVRELIYFYNESTDIQICLVLNHSDSPNSCNYHVNDNFTGKNCNYDFNLRSYVVNWFIFSVPKVEMIV